VSAAAYGGFFAAIGDPSGILGSTHGNWQAVRACYKPSLAVCAFFLALLSPETSALTAPSFAVTQVITSIVCCSVWAPRGRPLWSDPMLPLGVVVLIVEVVVWVAGGAVVGAGVGVLGRVIRARKRR
jgi:hypothetical protein